MYYLCMYLDILIVNTSCSSNRLVTYETSRGYSPSHRPWYVR
jgi:hypothetical protein